ncbi:MAG: ribosome recycling factor [bacterium]|nr:ribosome recycling factor [bacterium]
MANPIDHAKPDFDSAIDHLNKELRTIRSGRANSAVVEGIMVEAYDSLMDLKSVASISTPDARTIQIEPWDSNLIKPIEKALQTSSIGLNPNVAGTTIRLVMPPMTEENRKELVKIIHQKIEEARIRIRNVREEVRENIQAEERAKTISEDDRYNLQEKLDDLVGEYNKRADAFGKEKETDIMSI